MLTILLVEDQPAVATALQVLFEIRGVDSVVAREPAEALRLLEADASRSIGLVIQDMNFRPEATTGEEGVALFRSGGATRSTPLAAWVLRLQGNLSLVAVALSIFLLWQDLAWALPGLWLLLLGHSFYMLGGLAFEPFRVCGIVFQLGGVAALWPDGRPLLAFAVAAFVGNLWMAVGVWRERG